MRRKLLFALLTLSCATIFAQPVPELMWYKFQSGGTSVTNHATLAGTPTNPPATANIMGGITQGGSTICAEGLIGSGVSSTTDYLNTGWAPNRGSGAWTIAWRSSGISTNATLYYIFGDAGTASFRCFTNGVAGSTNWIIRGAGMTDVYINGGALSTPTSCAYVYDPTLGNIKGYLNGVLVTTVAQGAVNLTGTGPMKVMGYSANVGAPAGGVMDDFRMYNRALSASEVLAIHTGSLGDFLPATGNICGDSALIGYNVGTATYAWSTGATTDSIWVSSPGPYSLSITSTCANGADTIVMSAPGTLGPDFLGPDPSVCVGSFKPVGISVAMDSILWSTGAVTDSINVIGGSTYSVTAYSACGSYSDTITTTSVTPLSAGFLGADVVICAGDTATLSVGAPLDSLLWSTGDIVDPITTTTVGTYTVDAWNACGSYSDTIDVVASALVYTGFIMPDSATYCEGDTVTIVADSGYTSYLWSTGDTTNSITVIMGGTYTLTVTDACGSGAESATVTLGTAPVAAFSFSTTSGGTADFTDLSVGATTYAWDFGDGTGTSTSANPSYTYGSDGTYLVTLIVTNACGSDTLTDSVSITIVGMSDALDKGFQLFPNPARDEMNIQGTFNSSNAVVVTIESVLGEQMLRKELSSSNGQFAATVNLNDLSSGLYLVRFTSGGNTAVKRLVVNK